MKAIMISIKPKWVAKILNREKTIEIRKTCPEIFKHLKPYEGCSIDAYIYCTKDKPYLAHATELITGKYGCISNDEVSYEEHNLNGKVIAKFTLNNVEKITNRYCKGMLIDSCLTNYELNEYLGNNIGYAWHISNLEIFDKPKKLSEFKTLKRAKATDCFGCDVYQLTEMCIGNRCLLPKPLTKAPQSWQFVEVLE